MLKVFFFLIGLTVRLLTMRDQPLQAGNKSSPHFINQGPPLCCHKGNSRERQRPPPVLVKNTSVDCVLVLCFGLQFTQSLHPVNFSFKVSSRFLDSSLYFHFVSLYSKSTVLPAYTYMLPTVLTGLLPSTACPILFTGQGLGYPVCVHERKISTSRIGPSVQ